VRGGRILVVGATGRVGGAAVRHLLEAGFEVRALVRSAGKGGRLSSLGAEPVADDGCAGVFSALSATTERQAEEIEYRGNVNLLSAVRSSGATSSPAPTPPPSMRLTAASRGSGVGG
jgi:uncharacterized protein YbjT (DUF2867 family)